jgi:hypothetical protein
MLPVHLGEGLQEGLAYAGGDLATEYLQQKQCIFRIDSSPPTQDDNFTFTWKKWKMPLDVFIFTDKVAAVTTVLVLATTNLPDLSVIVSIHQR